MTLPHTPILAHNIRAAIAHLANNISKYLLQYCFLSNVNVPEKLL